MAAKAKATGKSAAKSSLAERLAAASRVASTPTGEPTADEVVDFGRFKGKTFGDLWRDADYVKWLVEHPDVLKSHPRMATWIDMQLTAVETGVGNLPGADEPGEVSASAPDEYAFPDADDNRSTGPRSSVSSHMDAATSSRLDAAEAQVAALTAQMQTLTTAVN